jgi:hypothetical protein
VEALDVWSRENGLPEAFVTEILRTPEQQEDIYSRYALGLIAKLRDGQDMPPKDRAMALELSKLVLPDIREWARRRFSWHLVGCAVDLRSRHYSMSQLARVMKFLRKRCLGPSWLVLAHDVTAPHIHIQLSRPEKRVEV